MRSRRRGTEEEKKKSGRREGARWLVLIGLPHLVILYTLCFNVLAAATAALAAAVVAPPFA